MSFLIFAYRSFIRRPRLAGSVLYLRMLTEAEGAPRFGRNRAENDRHERRHPEPAHYPHDQVNRRERQPVRGDRRTEDLQPDAANERAREDRREDRPICSR